MHFHLNVSFDKSLEASCQKWVTSSKDTCPLNHIIYIISINFHLFFLLGYTNEMKIMNVIVPKWNICRFTVCQKHI